MSVKFVDKYDPIFDPSLESVHSALRVDFPPIPRGICLLGIVADSIVDMCMPMRLGAMTRENGDQVSE
jgi:uncharacterized membrane protein YeiB